MTDIPGMIIWTGDYLADTTHLTTFEHGAYTLILYTMWRNGGKLAKDSKKLALVAKMSTFHWLRIEKKIMEFMTIIKDPDGSLWITQKRLQHELNLAQARNSKRVSSGRLGGIAKALKNNEMVHSNASGTANCSPYPLPHNTNININIKKESLNGGNQEKGRETAELVFVKEETEQWNAWTEFYRKSKRASPAAISRLGTHERGWYFPTEWPPSKPQEELPEH